METINDYMPLSHDWNNERLETLKKMFPDLFTNEGKLNIEELKKVVDPKSVAETERYEFRWFGKSQAKRNAFTPSNATLVYDEKRSVNPTESQNLIIEGENLEVMKLLSGSYRGEVKCIYIDPPYNTGKDFVYSDNFSQDKKAYWEDAGVVENGLKIDSNTETDGRYHSNWLNMMYSRLLLSRQLLKIDGVIFISIDDTEITNLRKLMDEVFGEENFVVQFVWQKGAGTQNDNNYVAISHEYVLCYAKNLEDCFIYNLPATEEMIKSYDLEDEFVSTRGKYQLRNLNDFSLGDRPGLHYDIKTPDGTILIGKEHQWRCDETRFNWRVSENRIIFKKDEEENEWEVFYKQYINEKKEQIIKDEHGNLLSYGKIPDSLLIKLAFTGEGKKDMKELFGNKIPFSYPKPVDLIRHIVKIGTKNSDLILDFFGGSGSTGQAVFEQNIDDGAKRKFILVQIPELANEKSDAKKAGYKKISDITIDRNKKVVEKIIEEKKKQQPDLFTNGDKQDALKGLGFKVFKLVKSNFPRVEFAPDPEKTETENIELLKKYISDKEAQLITAFNRD
ncbi:MAG: site-specific DNA-methyltransferase, partial [Cyclobacteriaceae bacterium]|nr:site-specific DNA-methyltransferase [Cyclobacteriaceae bacterium]